MPLPLPPTARPLPELAACPLQGRPGRAHLFFSAAPGPSGQTGGTQWEQRCAGPLDVAHPIVQVDGAPLCQQYRQVCFDQQTVVSFDPAHSPGNSTSEPIPRVPIEEMDYAWAGVEGQDKQVSMVSTWEG